LRDVLTRAKVFQVLSKLALRNPTYTCGVIDLARKLRLPAGRPAAAVNGPAGYHEQLGVPASLADELDFVQLFVRNAAELRELGPSAIQAVKPDGLLWITYPKGGRTKGVTDLPATPWWHRRDVLGEITGVTGYVPVAQVAIDDFWTALRFRRH